MRSNFCFDFVILVADHDANVRKYRELLGIEPIELAPESLPSADTRCTVFPLWNEGDRGMVLSLVTPGDPDSAQGRQLALAAAGRYDLGHLQGSLRLRHLCRADLGT